MELGRWRAEELNSIRTEASIVALGVRIGNPNQVAGWNSWFTISFVAHIWFRLQIWLLVVFQDTAQFLFFFIF